MRTLHRAVGMVVLALALLSSWKLAGAERISLMLQPNLTAFAEYRPGDPAKPAIIILHGFLQTHETPVVFSLTEGLSGAGFTVLAPTMTLGVTHRSSSLACEAIHTHTIDDHLTEVARWLDWLKQRHKGPVVLAGHSLGSLTVLAYLDRRNDPRITKAIGISIMEGRVRGDAKQQQQVVEQLKQRLAQGQNAPVKQPYSFCSAFNAAPKSMLSYLEWTPDRVMARSNKHRSRLVYIMGSRDDRLGPGWIEALQKTGVKVRIIPGANHFMDGSHEFDLLDLVIAELQGLRAE